MPQTTLNFLKDAVLDGDWDNLATPSARIVLGRLGTMGTGSFDVLTKVPNERFGNNEDAIVSDGLEE